jgi:hypothetical protein
VPESSIPLYTVLTALLDCLATCPSNPAPSCPPPLPHAVPPVACRANRAGAAAYAGDTVRA